MDIATQAQIIDRGVHSTQLLKSETLNAALDDMLRKTYEAFLSSQTDADVLVELHTQAVAIKALRGTLKRYEDDGKMEKAIREQNK